MSSYYRVLVLVRRSDSEHMQFLFLGKSKTKLYSRKPQTVEDLENEIEKLVTDITQAELQQLS